MRLAGCEAPSDRRARERLHAAAQRVGEPQARAFGVRAGDGARQGAAAVARGRPPLSRGRRLQEIAELVPEQRPLDLYAELAEVA